MAIKPQVFKVNLQIADMDRHYYQDHLLTVAQHPSETDERMMLRILAFALNANANLSFGEGLSDPHNQPDLWDKNYNGQIALWINVGLPDEKLIRKAVSRAEQVIVYSFGGRPAEVWWKKNFLANYANLRVFNLADKETKELAALSGRGIKLHVLIQDGEITISNAQTSLNIIPQVLK